MDPPVRPGPAGRHRVGQDREPPGGLDAVDHGLRVAALPLKGGREIQGQAVARVRGDLSSDEGQGTSPVPFVSVLQGLKRVVVGEDGIVELRGLRGLDHLLEGSAAVRVAGVDVDGAPVAVVRVCPPCRTRQGQQYQKQRRKSGHAGVSTRSGCRVPERARPRCTSLPSSRSQRTLLATMTQISQSLARKGTVSNARCRNGTDRTASCRSTESARAPQSHGLWNSPANALLVSERALNTLKTWNSTSVVKAIVRP